MSAMLISLRTGSPWVGLNLAFIFVMLALALTSDAQQKQAQKADLKSQDEIREMIETYARSVNEGDTDLAAKVWLDSADVSFIHPLGDEHGFDQIKQNFYRHLMGETFTERKLSLHDVSVHVHGNAAWAEFYWDFAARFRRMVCP